MKKIEPWKTYLFIGTLAAIALIINSYVAQVHRPDGGSSGVQQRPTANSGPTPGHPPPPPENQRKPVPPAAEPERPREAPAGPRQKTPQELAAERAQFLAKYLNTHDSRDPRVQALAIAIVSEKTNWNQPLTAAIVARCNGERLKVLPALFTPEFVSDGLFAGAFNGSTATSRSLDLANFLDLLLLGRQAVDYSTNAALNNVITANMRLELNAFSVGTGTKNQGWTFTANGAGFHPGQARSMAEERLLKQIARTNFTIGDISPNAH